MLFFKKKVKARTLGKSGDEGANGARNFKKAILNKKSGFAFVEAYKTARTNLIYSLSADGEGSKVVIFTSSVPSEGKTTTCVNLAITFAQMGESVIVLDSDLRKPKLHKCLDMNNEKGMSNYLAGLSKERDVIQKNQEFGFDVITAGHIPPNPSELLNSPRMKELLDYLSLNYKYIFLDMPPVDVVTDTVSISKYATGVVIVVRENYTHHELLKKAIESLEFANAKILGIVLNDINNNATSKYKYSKYGYRYSYRYKYNYNYAYGSEENESSTTK